MGENPSGMPPRNGAGFAEAFTTMLSLFGVLLTGRLATTPTTDSLALTGGSSGPLPRNQETTSS